MGDGDKRAAAAFDKVLLSVLNEAGLLKGQPEGGVHARDRVVELLIQHGWNLPQSWEDCRDNGHNDPTSIPEGVTITYDTPSPFRGTE